MGKDLRGKELGTGLSQRKDKKYLARYTDKHGKRHNFTSDDLKSAKKWLVDNLYNNNHLLISTDITFDNWYNVWFENKKRLLKEHTCRTYEQKYRLYVKDYIGDLPIGDIKKVQCQQVLNNMADKGLTVKTLKTAKSVMYGTFEYAVENDLIPKNPCVKLDVKVGKKNNKVYALTLEEQQQILDGVRKSPYYIQIALLLQTGMRTSELRGLMWNDIDFSNRTLTINRQLMYIGKRFMFETPKSENSARVIPLTDEAIRLLKLKKNEKTRSRVVDIQFKDIIFTTYNGTPVYDQYYNKLLKKVADDNNIEKRVTLHVLRHTFATRCIEAGVQPKVLQNIMGHSDIGVTMNLYVDATEEEKHKNILKFQNAIKIV